MVAHVLVSTLKVILYDFIRIVLSRDLKLLSYALGKIVQIFCL